MPAQRSSSGNSPIKCLQRSCFHQVSYLWQLTLLWQGWSPDHDNSDFKLVYTAVELQANGVTLLCSHWEHGRQNLRFLRSYLVPFSESVHAIFSVNWYRIGIVQVNGMNCDMVPKKNHHLFNGIFSLVHLSVTPFSSEWKVHIIPWQESTSKRQERAHFVYCFGSSLKWKTIFLRMKIPQCPKVQYIL